MPAVSPAVVLRWWFICWTTPGEGLAVNLVTANRLVTRDPVSLRGDLCAAPATRRTVRCRIRPVT